MATRVFMPKAGMAMEEGVIVCWLKKEGDTVEIGEPLLEIETDKVNLEVEATASGILLKITHEAGETVPVTETIGWIGEPGEEIEEDTSHHEAVSLGSDDQGAQSEIVALEPVSNETGVQATPLTVSSDGRIAATPKARRMAAEKNIDLATLSGTGTSGEIKARDVESIPSINVTPLARKIAMDRGLDLATLAGTGIGGKIQETDVLAADTEKSSSAPGTVQPAASKSIKRENITGMRKVIGERMLHSHLTTPPVTINAVADVTELLGVRKKINATLDVKISINDLVLKITAIALKDFPVFNASIEGEGIVYHSKINLGMAVALDEGLIVPVIPDAGQLSLAEISALARSLAEKARSGGLLPDQYTGGTFTISNMGGYGITSFTPIINPPESGILGVCAIEDRLTIDDSEMVVRKILGLSLTFDHRIVDGSQSAMFLNKIKTLLENPHLLMVY